MKVRHALVAAGLLLLAMAVPASAQDVKKFEVNLGAGFTVPYSDSGKSFGTGGNFLAGVDFNFNDHMGVEANYGYNRFGSKDIPVTGTPKIITDAPLTVHHRMHDGDFSFIYRFNKMGHVAPYALAGVGVYGSEVILTTPSVGFVTVCDPWIYVCFPAAVPVDQILGSRSSTDFGVHFGGGVSIPTGDRARFFVEVRFIHTYGPEIGGTKANGNYFPVFFGFKIG